MRLVKLCFVFVILDSSKSGRQVSRYLREEDRTRILGAHKTGFFVENLADYFNLDGNMIYGIVCRRTLTRRACGGRKSRKVRTVSKALACNKKGQFTELFLLYEEGSVT